MKSIILLLILTFSVSGCGGSSAGSSVLNDGGAVGGLKGYLLTNGIDEWSCDLPGSFETVYLEFFADNTGVFEINFDGRTGFNFTIVEPNKVKFQFPASGAEDEWTVTRLDNVNFSALSINGAVFECERG